MFTAQTLSNLKRVNHGPVTPGRESFRQGRSNGTKCNGNNPETVGSNNIKDTNTHPSQSLNIDKPTHPPKGQMRRYVKDVLRLPILLNY